MRTFFSWLLPLLASLVMFMGTLLGGAPFVETSGDPSEPAVVARTAVHIGGTFLGFLLALATRITVKLMHRDPPRRIGRRLGLSLVGGVVIGALLGQSAGLSAWSSVAFLLMLVVPIVATWSWRRGVFALGVPAPEAAAAEAIS